MSAVLVAAIIVAAALAIVLIAVKHHADRIVRAVNADPERAEAAAESAAASAATAGHVANKVAFDAMGKSATR